MSATFTPPASREYAPFYAGYIARVPEGDLEAQLARQHERTRALLAPLSASQARHRYAPGKWSVIQVLGHMTDAERVFAYRALRFARGDETPLAGFDEAAWVPAGGFERRALGDVLDEFGAVRKATLALLGGLDPEAVARGGLANDKPITVRALAYIIAGHELHHVSVLRERYGLGDAAR